MGAIIVRDRCSQRPITPVEIDWTNPLAKGLRYFVLLDAANYRINLVTGAPLSVALDSGVAFSGTSAWTFNAEGYQAEYALSKPDWIGGYAVSCRGMTAGVYWMFASGSAWDGLYEQPTDNLILTSSSGFGGSVTPSGVSTGGFTRMCASVPAANNFRAVKGVGDVAIDTSAALPTGAMTKLVLGGDYEQANRSAVEFDYFAVWDRPPSDDEMRAFNASPYSVLRRKAKILYFPSAGGGGATITGDGLTQGHSLGSPALTQASVLAVQAVAQSQSLDAPALTQHNVLAVNAIAQAHALGNVTLTQAHILTVQGIGQAHSLGTPSLTQHNALAPAAMTQAQTLGNITLTIAGQIAAADIAQGHSIGTPALTQHNVLAVAALMQAHSLGQPSLSQAGTLAVQNMTQAQVLDAVTLVQHHALAVQALLQGHALGSITLTASDALAIDGLTHAQILGAPSLTQHNVLAVQSMTHAQILQAVTLGGLVIGSLRGTLVAYSLLDGEVVCRALLSGSPTTVH